MKKAILYIITLFLIYSCELTNVLENDPPNNLVSENVVKNQTDARALLNGCYAIISLNQYYYVYTELIPSTLIGSMSRVGSNSDLVPFAENSLSYDNSYSYSFWNAFYKVIDGANHTIFQTTKLSSNLIPDTARKEIIGEARFVRAMATFDVLRYFGQFFDMNSKFGIILRTEPANFVNRDKARSTVAECYAQILADLDAAIADAPDYSVSYKGSKTAAKALKARVLVYQGKYAEAAVLANEVINDGTTSLEADFETAFSTGIKSSEMILMVYTDEETEQLRGYNVKRFYSGRPAENNWFTTLMDTDPRKPFTYEDKEVLKTTNKEVYKPTYFLRLPEMYLIKAEGLAFSGASLADASAPLNVIRNRAGIGNTLATNIQELKDDIFNEYARELAYENGAEWFAAIRFGKAEELKPSIKNSDQYILPIPRGEIENNAGLSLADQNPGYE
ncbi:RagB/SusD family nutrient uptake outer membrane protein [Polaribacter cellanae]|uniref:RagB/SusD family nutrient uptake outer membrane protein n=1 Tax=Polaribacter cellanae TaxID=2818493 RepID=A0A975H6U0_9FLAO|nr:RagB/SusD family nutrient uptake outer membrane protein [Polaribacter cellanae]QTE22363.1 RagB/SusD family nutrient uptake outer membrane protein [Polaribacter cellanae]